MMKKRSAHEKKTEDVQENAMVRDMDDVEELGKEMEQISQNKDYPIDRDEGLEKETGKQSRKRDTE